MAIFRKDHVTPYLHGLETYYQALHAALNGTPGSANVAYMYHTDNEQFRREYVDINFEVVERMIRHFKVEVEEIKNLKKKMQKPLPSTL